MKVQKRNGRIVEFDKTKIINAISRAGYVEDITKHSIADYIESFKGERDTISIEEIQDIVEQELMNSGSIDVAKEYIRYRFKRQLIRESESANDSILDIVSIKNEEINDENSNKNPTILSTQRDYMAGEISKDLSRRLLLTDEIIEFHDSGKGHFHDMDYFVQEMHNCCLINLEDMLQNGTVVSNTMIEKPHSFLTACNIATQIMAQVASNQYGGQSVSLAHLAPFVDITRQRIKGEVYRDLAGAFEDQSYSDREAMINKITERRVKAEIKQGVQIIQYQILTLMTTNGQAPFVTLWMYLGEVPEGRTRDDLALIIEEILTQRHRGVKNEKGEWITPAFPKLVYAVTADNVRPGTKYFYLTKLAAKCTSKRLVPDYVSEKKMLEYKIDKNGEGHCYPPMGCRSFLTPYVTPEGESKYYGRFNQGVVTINLPHVALSAKKQWEDSEETLQIDDLYNIFWEIFEERLEICHRGLQQRHNRLKGTVSDVSPIHWQHGALARLEKGETIDKLLYGGYSTISLGYAGLYECVYAMTGKSHTDEEAKPFALAIMQKMNDKCKEWKAMEGMDYSLYGTPIESTTYKFAKALKDTFGVIEGVSDHDYITNSYHVNVREKIDPFTKLKFESEFQALSPGGAISYIETSDLTDNIDAILAVIEYIYENIIYAELNSKSDYCHVCGYDGEIKIVENDEGKLVWECPNCGNRNQNKMNVARRTCGYIGSNFWNQGRTEEIRDRYVHLGGDYTDTPGQE